MTEKMYETPETNVKLAALNLLKWKMERQIANGSSYPSIDYEDVNEVLMVAGMGVIIPESINKKDVEVI